MGSVKHSVDSNTPYAKMFFLLFGETLAAFLGILVTVFFFFHVWLMLKSMTTIEFCEKSMKKSGYDSSQYSKGICGNIMAVLGDNPLFWLFPCSPPSGRGLFFREDSDSAPLARELEPKRGIRGKGRLLPYADNYGSSEYDSYSNGKT